MKIFSHSIKKMPTSLNPPESQAYDLADPISKSTFKRKPRTTNKMVEEALIEMHNVKGVTLKQIYNFLLENYNLELISKIRVSFVKKYLRSLMESEDVVNVTGNGLSGHFKLANKKNFLKKIKTNDKKTARRSKAISHEDTNSKMRNVNQNNEVTLKRIHVKVLPKKTRSKSKHPTAVIPQRASPISLPKDNSSMFDTPMVQTRIRASTPFITSLLVPRAPEARKRHYKEMPHEINGTPRSSLSDKMRKLRKRRED